MRANGVADGGRLRLALAWAGLIAFAALAIARAAVPPAEIAEPALRGAGDIELALLSPRGEAGPSVVSVRFESSANGDSSHSVPRSAAACRQDGERWRCRLPSGRLDLRITAAGFIPQYLWQVVISPGKLTRLGPLALAHGSSIVGRVETANGAAIASSCRVELLASGLVLLHAEDPRRTGVRSGKVGARGFFQLDGVAPGSYALTARQPGFATTTLLPVVVEKDQETQLAQPLILTPPLQLEVELTPALDPWGQPWRVVLMRKELALAKLREAGGGPSVDGRFSRRELDPGLYSLDVRDSQGASFLSEDVDLESDRILIREIPLVLVEGTVSKGESPFATRLGFFTGSRSTAIRMDSDAKGRFTGFLPREGRWRLYLPEFRRTLRVVVERAKGARSAKLDVIIPDRRLAGEVVDESSMPVPGALVTAEGFVADDAPAVQSDGKGNFLLDGLPDEPHLVMAEAEVDDRVLSAEPLVVTPSADPAGGSLRLVLHEKKRLAGIVSSPAGPVAGAHIEATPRGHLAVLTAEATTDASGRFRLDVPAEAAELQLLVMPPGFALRTVTLRAPFPDPLPIAVDDAGGSLVVRTPSLDLADLTQAQPLIVVDGQAIPLASLVSWARTAGEGKQGPRRYEIPRLQAGDYSACLVTLPEQIQVVLGLAALTGKSCDRGTLAPHGELVLDLARGVK
jgi:hypothetical protein